MLGGNYDLILCDSDYAFASLSRFLCCAECFWEAVWREMMESIADLVNYGTLGKRLSIK